MAVRRRTSSREGRPPSISSGATTLPKELQPHRIRTRIMRLGAIVASIALVIVLVPGADGLRDRLAKASPGWLALGVALEVGSTLSYVVIFRSVFCPRMSWRLSYHIGMAEQAANSLLPIGGAGGLALGAWALTRTGMAADQIARRTVAFVLLTSLANFATLIVFAAAFAVGVPGDDPAPGATLGFGAAAATALVLGLGLPALTARFSSRLRAGEGHMLTLLRRGAAALGGGVVDSIALLRTRDLGVLLGSLGYMGFDIAVLGVSFRAFGHSPSLGILVVAYIIGQLGALVPTPGGIGGIEAGLIGTFALYHVPLTTSAAAIIAYRAIALWTPLVLGSIALVALRGTLQRGPERAAAVRS